MKVCCLSFVTLAGLSMLAGNGCGGTGKAHATDSGISTDASLGPDAMPGGGAGGAGGVTGVTGSGGVGSGGLGTGGIGSGGGGGKGIGGIGSGGMSGTGGGTGGSGGIAGGGVSGGRTGTGGSTASAAWAAEEVAAALVEAARLVVRTQGRLAMAWSLTREPADRPYPIAQGLSAERINRCSK